MNLAWLIAAVLFVMDPSAAGTRPATQPATRPATEVIVIGTVHEATASFPRAALDQILSQLRPDVLLLELDRSFFDDAGALRPEFRQITLETASASSAATAASLRPSGGVVLRPYDIEGRNAFFERNDYFNREARLYRALHERHQGGKLAPEARATFEALLAIARVRDAFMNERPDVINSAACDAAIEAKHGYAFQGAARIVELTPALADHAEFVRLAADFWRQRNDAMADNIARHARDFPGRRIVVLCGLEHRSELRKRLGERSAREGFVLREYWEPRN